MREYYKANNQNYLIDIKQPPQYDGGKVVIDRLKEVFKVNSRLQLADLLGFTSGTISTWQTRNTIPYEALIRTHLGTGVPMEYLCFGKGKSYQLPESEPKVIKQESSEMLKMPLLEVKSIEDGNLQTIERIRTDIRSFEIYGILPHTNDFALRRKDKTFFINSRVSQVSKGKYLFSTNNVYQLGELRLMPDGNIYLIDGDDKYQINSSITHIHGKVTAAVENY